MDTIPEDIYQHIFSYLLGDTVWVDKVFFNRRHWTRTNGINPTETYELQLVNKRFKHNFEKYLKTKPLVLHVWSFRSCIAEWYLHLVKALKKYDVENLYSFKWYYGRNKDGHTQNIIEELHGLNFKSLRSLHLHDDGFDFEILGECKQLTYITLDYMESLLDEVEAEKLKTFLSLHKHTVERLSIANNYDLIPDDSWPNLKRLFIRTILWPSTMSKVLKSSTLESLFIHYDSGCYNSTCNMVIKCPNLKVMLINNIGSDHQIKSTDRSPYRPYGLISRRDRYFSSTCPPTELSKIGIKVLEVRSNCDIGMCWEDARHLY